MDYSNITLFSAMKQKMLYLSERQAMIAQNISNADTPGYKSRDIEKPDFAAMAEAASGRLQLAVTDKKHISASSAQGGHFKMIEHKPTWETTPTENTVSLDEEIKKLGLNQSEYQQVTALYRKTVDMFKTSIGRVGGA